MKTGVNFFGPYEARDSIGRAASLNIACLDAGGVLHDVYKLSRPGPKEVVNYGTIDDEMLSGLSYRINLFHFNARRVPLYFSRLGEDSLKGFYNIGFWVHEMQTIPNQWARQLEFFDEIWTPSAMCQNAVAMSSNIPVVCIPHPIETKAASGRVSSVIKGKKYGCFNFLSVFDVFSDAERKNPLFVVRAFLNAHAGNPDVRLILKVRNLEHDESLGNLMRQICSRNQNVMLIDGFVERSALDRLYDEADAYVSMHRAEGFGLTISDAMSRGIPVITTGYSGNMDFCNASDTRVVAYTLREVGHERPRYRRDDIWAEPDMEDATEAFVDLVERHEFWAKKAEKARARISREFSVDRIGCLMRKRLDLIGRNFNFPDDMTGRRIDVEVGVCDTYGF